MTDIKELRRQSDVAHNAYVENTDPSHTEQLYAQAVATSVRLMEALDALAKAPTQPVAVAAHILEPEGHYDSAMDSEVLKRAVERPKRPTFLQSFVKAMTLTVPMSRRHFMVMGFGWPFAYIAYNDPAEDK
ncbi:MAG: hypothetical protein WAQ27_03370 [Candidatus Microsaccharimonas sp.]